MIVEAAKISRVQFPWFLALVCLFIDALASGQLSRAATLSLATNSLAIGSGGKGAFEVVGDKSGYRFQWWFGGSTLPGQTNSTIGFANAQASQSGTYVLRGTNGATVVELNGQLEVLTTLRDQLVGEWLMDGNGNDSSGRDHYGMLEGGGDTVNDRYGRFLSALLFDSNQGSRLTVVDHPDFAFGSNPFTIVAWCKQPPFNVGWGPGNMIGQDFGYAWFLSQTLSFEWRGPGGDGFVLNDINTPGNQWFLMTVTREGPTWLAYINGVAVSEANHNSLLPDVNAPLVIGGLNEFYGELDEVRIYRRALTSQEVAALYTGEKADWLKVTQQPFGGWHTNGSSFAMTVAAEGVGPLKYQWLKNWEPLEGKTNTTLALAAARISDSGVYSVRVTGAAGSITSAPASLLIYWPTNLVEAQAGTLTSSGGSTGGIAAGDYNNDGWTDVFVANHYSPSSNFLFRNEKNGTFSTVTSSGTMRPTRGLQGSEMYQGSYFVDYNNDGWLDLFVTGYQAADGSAGKNLLYRNSNGTLELINDGSWLTQGFNRTDSAVWADLDGDRLLDVVLASRDGELPVFKNRPDGTFALLSEPWLPGGAISVSLGDVDGDRDLDVLTGGVNGVKLFRNLGGFLFQEITGTGMTMDGEALNSTHFVDWDGDGDLDIGLSTFNALRRLYRNDGTNVFTLIGEGSNHGLVYADLNLDGQLEAYDAGVACDINNDNLPDLIVTQYNNQNEKVYTNKWNGASWLKVKLKGVVSNPRGIGAKVRAKAIISGEEKWQTRMITAGEGYHGSMPAEAYFGFGDATEIETLRVEWPSGATTETNNVPINQPITVEEIGEGSPIIRVNGIFSGTHVHFRTNNEPVAVTISGAYPNIFYTTNGTLADVNSTPYTGSFFVRPPAVVHATAYNEFFEEAPPVEAVTIAILPTYQMTIDGGGGDVLLSDGPPYFSNTVVTVIAMAHPGWTFMRWEENGVTTSTLQTNAVLMDRDKIVRVVYGTTVEARPVGSAFKNPESALHEYGSKVLLWSVPASDKYFLRWNFAGNPSTQFTNSPYWFPVTTPTNIATAVFLNLGANKSLTLLYEGEGEVTRNPGASYSYAPNTSVQLTATAHPGWQFVNWDNNANLTNPVRTVVMDANKTVTARFGQRPAIRIIEPLANSVLNGAVSNVISTEVTLTEGAIDRVVFYANGQVLGTNFVASDWSWRPGEEGMFDLTAVAYSTLGVSGTSAPVRVEVMLPPALVNEVIPRRVREGEYVYWAIQATGSSPMQVLWKHNGSVMSSRSGLYLDLGFVGETNAGGYQLVLSNEFGTVESQVATLTVVKPGNEFTKWDLSTGQGTPSEPAVAHDGTAYITIGNQLKAIDPEFGLKWSFTTVGFAGAIAPTIGPDGTIYVVGATDRIYAVRPDGTEKWKYNTGLVGEQFFWPVAIGEDGSIYGTTVQGSTGRMRAVRPDGTLKWTYGPAQTWRTGPVVGKNGDIYVVGDTLNDDTLFAITANGAQRWTNVIGGSREEIVIGREGEIITVGSKAGAGGILSFLPENGSEKWFRPNVMPASDPVVVGSDGTIYVNGGTTFYALNGANGTVNWSKSIRNSSASSPAVAADGSVSFLTAYFAEFHLHTFEADGTLRRMMPLSTSNPLGHLVLGENGLLYTTVAPSGSPPKLLTIVHEAPVADSSWPLKRKAPGGHGNSGGIPGDYKWSRRIMTPYLTSSFAKSAGDSVYGIFDGGIHRFLNGTESTDNANWQDATPIMGLNGMLYAASQVSWTAGEESSRLLIYNTVTQQAVTNVVVPGAVWRGIVALGQDGTVYLGSTTSATVGRLYSWNAGAGLVEVAEFAGPITSPPVVQDPTHVLVGAGGSLYRVSSGEIVDAYSHPTAGEALGEPVVDDNGAIYLGSESGELVALSSNLQQKWLEKIGYTIDSTPAIGPDGAIYVAADANLPAGEAFYLYAFRTNGTMKWSAPVLLPGGATSGSSPAVGADGTIYLAGRSMFFAVRDLGATAEVAWTHRLPSDGLNSPLLTPDKRLYFAGGGSWIMSLQASSGPADSAWPMYRGNMARTGNAIPFNLPPMISITDPVAGTVLYSPAEITIRVAVSDGEGFVKRVEYFNGDTMLGASTTSPFSFTTTLAAGSYSLRARAIDDGDLAAFSTNVPLTVSPPAKPVVNILTPSSSDLFQAPTNITFTVQATDADGFVTRLEFYSDQGQLGTVVPTSAQTSFTWINPTAGLRTFYVRAYDDDNTFTDSASLIFDVQQPLVTKFRWASGTAPALENGGTITLTIVKSGTGAVSVNYATQPVSAEPGRDYVTREGFLNFASSQTSSNISISILNDYIPEGAKQFYVRLSSPSGGAQLEAPDAVLVTIQDDDADLANSSLIDFRPSASRPSPSGSLRVNLTPAQDVGAWRFPWETAWRVGGTSALDLDPGDYPIQFRPVVNYEEPTIKTNSILSGLLTTVQYPYVLTGAQTGGALSVYFENLTTMMQSGALPGWRLDGETTIRRNGDKVSSLPAGTHVIEFTIEPANAGWVTPSAREVLVQEGVDTTLPITYAKAPPEPSGVELPFPLTYTAVRDGQFPPQGVARQPYPMVGQLRSPAGSGSGVAVRDRVVLTAAHVLFDETTTNFVDPSSVMWFAERIAGEYEPKPLYPLGFYVHTNYLKERTLEREQGKGPGEAGAASQQWDVAALYFGEPAARNGQTGYLLSDSAVNEWLNGPVARVKQLIGYPLKDPHKGKMHETRARNYLFANEIGPLFLSSEFLSYPGNSGGPLWSLYSSAEGYIPSGVYLGSRVSGGRTYSVVRAIDSMVASLINRAQSSAELGLNFGGQGGAVRIGVGGFGALVPSTLVVVLEPAAARLAGAKWHVVGAAGGFKNSGETYSSPTAEIDLEFAPAPGFATPSNRHVSITGGGLTNTITITYGEGIRLSNAALTAERKLRFSIDGSGGNFVIERTAALESNAAMTVWTPVATNTAPFVFEGPVVAPNEKRYYRARMQ